jgi:hypothetical protein
MPPSPGRIFLIRGRSKVDASVRPAGCGFGWRGRLRLAATSALAGNGQHGESEYDRQGGDDHKRAKYPSHRIPIFFPEARIIAVEGKDPAVLLPSFASAAFSIVILSPTFMVSLFQPVRASA